jgi:uncharacterized protein YegP (UPF0339 family)
MAGQCVLQKASNGQFMFNLKAENGEKILTSELYTTKQSATNGVAACRTNSDTLSNYENRSSVSGSPYFVLKAQNGEIIGKSVTYSCAAARDVGISSCMSNGPWGALVDMASA